MSKVRLWIDFPDEESMLDFADTLNLGMTKPEERIAVFQVDDLDTRSVRFDDVYILKRNTDRPEQFRLRRKEPDYRGSCLKCGRVKVLIGSVCGDCYTGTVRAENT